MLPDKYLDQSASDLQPSDRFECWLETRRKANYRAYFSNLLSEATIFRSALDQGLVIVVTPQTVERVLERFGDIRLQAWLMLGAYTVSLFSENQLLTTAASIPTFSLTYSHPIKEENRLD